MANNPNVQQTGYNQWSTNNPANFEYYSGSQVTIWFGDILIDDILQLNWDRSQNKRPIWGYASQQFDAVAKGIVQIQGSFVINFRQAGYLALLMSAISGLYDSFLGDRTSPDNSAVRQAIGTYLRNGMFGPMAATDPSQAIRDLGNDPNFLSLVKSYEDIIWGGGVPGANEAAEAIVASTSLPADTRQQQEIPDGFTIMVSYGNTSASDPKTMNDYIQSTTQTLNGVHIMGESKVIGVGGNNIVERYDFIARGTDEGIGTSR
jgi:hypothetical protein